MHPLVTESVEYTTQRTELMMGLFYLATLFTSLRYFTATTSKHQMLWLLLAGVACAAGMACKETMVSAPFAVLLFERTFLARSFWRALRRSWPLYVALALGWIVLLTLNLGGPRSASAGFHRGIPAHVWWFTQAKVLAMYFKLSFWPWPLSVHYRVPLLETFAVAWPWLVFALVLGIGILIALGRRSAAGFIGACAVMTLAPTLAVPILKEVAVERRMYLPLAAILTLTIVGGYRLLCSVAQVPASNEPKIFRWPLAATLTFGAILVVVMGAVSSLRLTAYRDAVTLWQDAARRDPNDLIAIQNTGIALNDAQRSEEAARYMRQALERFPDWPEGYHVLGVALINLQRPAEAIDYLEKSFPSPDDTLAHFHLGLALLNAGRPVEAIDQFEMVVQEQPDVSTFQNRLGMALFLAGRPQPALEHFRKAVALEPDSAMIRKNLALTLKAVNSLPEAREEFEKTIRLAPDDLDARAQLAIVYNDLGQSADAVATAEKALAMARAAGNVPMSQSLENWLKQNRK
ncbi:MAG TPA: tetratricopeptide repeat protein [Gemmataceae bacterium]|nr:tetratricopeptide repeat protein [Gemmataceae bacterium]